MLEWGLLVPVIACAVFLLIFFMVYFRGGSRTGQMGDLRPLDVQIREKVEHLGTRDPRVYEAWKPFEVVLSQLGPETQGMFMTLFSRTLAQNSPEAIDELLVTLRRSESVLKLIK